MVSLHKQRRRRGGYATMAEFVVMRWLRPHLDMERQELEGLQLRWAEINEIREWHTCLSTDCSDCDTYREYLEMVAEDIREIQDRVRGVVALAACCKDM